MKFLRIGNKGKEKPAALDKSGKIRDLSSKIKDFIILEKNYFIKKSPTFYPKKIMTKFMGQL